MKASTRMNLSQTVAMTPQLLQSIRLLQLSAIELEQEVADALENNALLEREDDEIPFHSGDEAPAAGDAEERLTFAADSLEAPVSGCDESATERVEAEFDWSSAEAWSGGEPAEDGEPIEARRAAPVTDDARVAALSQLELTIATPREWQLAVAIIEQIDDNGYLEMPLDVLLATLPADWQTSLAELEAVLIQVQSVEPSGFAARALGECLFLQLEALKAGTQGRNLAERLVMDHLDRVAAHDYAALRRELQVTEDQMLNALALIRTLDPKPGASRIEPAQAVVPDLIVSGVKGAWRVELNPANLPRLRINGHYEKLATNAAHRGLREQLQQARWLVRGLDVRHDTLLRAGRVIFERQRDFLRRGEEGMLPLTLREVAETIQMHESSVCRVTSNKFVATPWGVYPMKAFFPSQIQATEGETSGIAVRAMIRRIVDGEKATAPLCDGAIAAILARTGVRIARRTVAKYRESMKIAPADRRASAGAGTLRMAS